MSPAFNPDNPLANSALRSKPSPRQLRDEIVRWVAKLRSVVHSQFEWDLNPQVQACLIPIDTNGKMRHACPVQLKGFDERGVAFEHSRPLPDRRAMFSVEGPTFGRFVAEVDLAWSSYLEGGGYASGGRIVQLVSIPNRP